MDKPLPPPRVHFTPLKFAFIFLLLSFELAVAENPLSVVRGSTGGLSVRWEAAVGWEYEIESADDLGTWQSEGVWTGTGGLIGLAVFEALPGGGNPPAVGPDIPTYTFRVNAYDDGHSLISWIGENGQPYQVYQAIDFDTHPIVPLFRYRMEDNNSVPIYDLFLISGGVSFQPSFSGLTVSALPLVEQAHFALLNDAVSGINAAAAAHPPSGNDQSGSLVLNTIDAHYFRLTTRRLDSDGDGIWNDLETITNPLDADTDNDGVTDPWSLLNRTEPIISEFCASNQGIIADGEGDFSDWFEIFNPTPNTIDLTGWHCSDDENNLNDWEFPPGTTIAPGETLLIFASNKDPAIPELAGEFHADFKLSAEEASLFLSMPDPADPDELLIVDAHRNFQLTRTNATAGWGLDRDAGLIPDPSTNGGLRFFVEPTPGEMNSFESCTGFSQPPVVTPIGQILTGGSVTVTFAPPATQPGSVIHYTLDGSNPTLSSPIADGPLTVDSTTVVRAVSQAPGCAPSFIVARSFIFTDDILGTAPPGTLPTDHQVRPAHYPVNANTASNGWAGVLDYAMDPRVIAEEKAEMVTGLTTYPALSISLPVEDFFGRPNGVFADSTGTMTILPEDPGPGIEPPPGDPRRVDPLRQDWRRFASFEYISPGTPGDLDDPAQYAQEAGEITISGAISRNYQISAKHNLRLIFKARNSLRGDEEWRFENLLFKTSPNRFFTQLQLRNPTGDSWTQRYRLPNPPGQNPRENAKKARDRATYVREAWARKTFRAMNPPSGASGNFIAHRRWVNLFVNGLYWGIYDLTERVDEDFAKSYLGSAASYDVIKSEKKTRESGSPFLPVEIDGSLGAWELLIDACELAQANPTDPNSFTSVTSLLDLDSYFDYLLVNFYMHNADWGSNGNNWRAFRRRGTTDKFRFTIWDAEIAMSPAALADNSTYFDGNKGALLPHSLLKDREDYKAAFQQRIDLHFHTPGGVFSVDGTNHQITSVFQEAIDDVSPLMSLESARWGDASLQPGEGTPHLYRVDDPSYQPPPQSGAQFGDFERSTLWHRDTFLKDRRTPFLNQIEAALAPENP